MRSEEKNDSAINTQKNISDNALYFMPNNRKTNRKISKQNMKSA